LLLLAAALHDLGKTESGTDELGSHAERSAAAADGILDRLGLSERQKKLVLDVIRYHIPPVGRLRGERWDERVEREGLDVLYEEMVDRGRNEHPVETALHYHADILGRRGSETSTAEIERRQRVTTFLLERCLGEPPGEG
ncbi:MAG: HD domain-containing protein, partial [Dehalococcoidia bacterium]